jgi:hypothetical protein
VGPEGFWDDDGLLLSQEEFERLLDTDEQGRRLPRQLSIRCRACQLQYAVLFEIAQECGDPSYYEAAQHAISVRQKVLTFGWPVQDLSDYDYHLMEAAHAAIVQFENYKAYKRQKEIERQNK